MLRKSSALLVWFLLMLLSSCNGSGPADAAREWAMARTSQKGGEALRLTCEELRTVVQSESFLEAGISGFLQLGTGQNPEIEADLTEVSFEVISEEDRSAIVHVKGDAFLTIMGAGTVAPIDERWVMIEEGDQWRWCGLEGEDLSVLSSSSIVSELSNDPLAEIGELFEPPRPQPTMQRQSTASPQRQSTDTPNRQLEEEPESQQPFSTIPISVEDLDDSIIGTVGSIAVRDNILLAGIGPYFVVIDVSNKAHPPIASVMKTQPEDFWITDIETYGDIAYFFSHHEDYKKVDIFNISDIFDVSVITSLIYPVEAFSGFLPFSMALDNGILALGGAALEHGESINYSDLNLGLKLFDLSNPSSPSELGSIELPIKSEYWENQFLLIAYKDGVVYLGEMNAGISILDVTNPKAITKIGHINIDNPSIGLVLNNEILYVITLKGVYLIDVNNPFAPRQMGLFDADFLDDQLVCGIAFLDNIAYYLSSDADMSEPSTLFITDAINPMSPVEISHLVLSDPACFMTVGDGLIYVTGDKDILIIDVSNPSAPVERSKITP